MATKYDKTLDIKRFSLGEDYNKHTLYWLHPHSFAGTSLKLELISAHRFLVQADRQDKTTFFFAYASKRR